MTLRTRLLAVIMLATVGSVLATAVILAGIAFNAMLRQAGDEAASLARLLSRVAAVAEEVPVRVDRIIERERLATAYTLAELVAVERARGNDPADLRHRLRDITAKTTAEEIRVLDASGRSIAASSDEADRPIVGDRELLTGDGFGALLGRRALTVAPADARVTAEGREFGFVGARVAGAPDSVVVAYDTALSEVVRDQIGLGRTLRSLLSGGAVEAVWLVDETGRPVAASSIRSPTRGDGLSPDEAALAALVLRDGEQRSEIKASSISVAAPVLDADGIPSGAVLLRLPTTRLFSSLRTWVTSVAAIATALIAIGYLTARATARRIADPISRITAAAAAIERRRFDPAALAPVERREDEIGGLARVFRVMAVDLLDRERVLDDLVGQRTRELVERNGQLASANRQIESELLAARQLQAAILPQRFEPSPRYACSAVMIPATQLAGDFYDFIRLDADRIGILVADVSGKGVPAAFFMGISRTVMLQAARVGGSPGACLAATNEILCDTNPTELFVTIFYAVIDLSSGRMSWSSGGHNPPYLGRADGSVERLPMAGAPPLGVFKEARYADHELSLAPGDAVVLYTDGVTEAMDAHGGMFGEARLVACIGDAAAGSAPGAVLASITQAVRSFVASPALSDDLTCLVLRYTRGEPTAPAA